ncbi:MAG: CHASE3 domain-containing protein [Burkholderiales bacterium]|nr:CHASE3 domain-containing protein [Burkholderiales bacterium]
MDGKQDLAPDRQDDLTLSGFVASAVVALVLVGGTYWMSLKETQAQHWISHSRELLATLAATRADVVDIQNGQRGFVVTGNDSELQLYDTARKEVEDDLQRLRDLTLDNPAQQALLRELEGHLATRLAIAATTIEARRAGGFGAAKAIMDRGTGQQEMASLRELLQRMENAEGRLLAQRLASHERFLNAFWSGMAALLLALLAALAVLYQLFRRKRQAERRLFEGEQQFHLMTDSITEYAILRLDAEGCVRTWNPGSRRIKGYEEAEIVGQHFSRFYTPEDRAAGLPQRALETAQKEGRFSDEGWRLRKDGSRFWAAVAIAPLRDAQGRLRGFAKVTRDLSERKAAEEELQRLNSHLESLVQERTSELQESNQALRAARDRLQALSSRLITAQEEERRHVARELHDETGQALTLIRMQLSELASAGPADAPRVGECLQSVDRAISHIRGLSLRLRPPMLDDLGLSDAVEWVAGQQARAAGWALRLDVQELDERLPGDVETACFRICQEALTNAARYARATEVAVSLRRAGDELELVVADNGGGFDLARYRTPEERRKHFGLVSMSERAALAGGRLEIDTAPGRGTRVHAVFDLSPRHGDQPASAPGELFA